MVRKEQSGQEQNNGKRRRQYSIGHAALQKWVQFTTITPAKGVRGRTPLPSYFSDRRRKSFSFSQTGSSRSVSGNSSIRVVQGFLKAFGSSTVTCTSMWPKSLR